MARFILEAQAACAVEHPNVVEILDFVEPGAEPPLLVMELLQGETLAAKLSREHALPLEDTANLLVPVVSAVGTAHSRGIIHRDLKPANIFLTERTNREPIVKVLDFGIAKWVAQRPDGAGLRTQTGSTLGTPCYMAPEQAIGERLIDHGVDVWSLGIILYECLAGARPVEGENAAQTVVRLLNTGIMPIERVVPTLPHDVAKLVGQMLSRDPARRPKDLREVFDVLKAYSTATAPAFAEPALESIAVSEPADVTRSSAPAVVWIPKTSPETLAQNRAAEPAQASDTAGRRRMIWWVSGVAAAAALFAVSSSLRGRAPATAPSESLADMRAGGPSNSAPLQAPLIEPAPTEPPVVHAPPQPRAARERSRGPPECRPRRRLARHLPLRRRPSPRAARWHRRNRARRDLPRRPALEWRRKALRPARTASDPAIAPAVCASHSSVNERKRESCAFKPLRRRYE